MLKLTIIIIIITWLHNIVLHAIKNLILFIGASLSESLLDELAGAFLWYIYIYDWKSAVEHDGGV